MFLIHARPGKNSEPAAFQNSYHQRLFAKTWKILKLTFENFELRAGQTRYSF